MNKTTKKILASLTALGLLSSGAVFAEYDPDKVIDPNNPIMTLSGDAANDTAAPEGGENEAETPRAMNGASVNGVETVEVDGHKMIPLRAVAEGLGYTVTWNEEGQSIELLRGAQYITMAIAQDAYAFSRRAPQELGAAPTLVNGDTTYVPVNFVDEILGGYTYENEDGTLKVVLPSIVTVKEITEGGSLLVDDSYLGDVIVHIGEDTVITAGDKEAAAEDIKADMVLAVEYSDAMAASLPPQTTAVKINIENTVEETAGEDEEATFTFEGTISEITENLVTIGKAFEDDDAVRLVISEDTVITKGNDKRIYKLDDLQVGMKISGTHDEAMTMSIPPQTAALTVNIESDDAEEPSEEQEIAEAKGTVTEIVGDDMVVIHDGEDDEMGVALIVTEDTVITKGDEKKTIEDLTVGTKVEAKHSMIMTRSIPPQTVAYEIEIVD